MEISAGLNISSVSRLKFTWKSLPPKYRTLFEQLVKLTGSDRNFDYYRQVVAKCSYPILPYLGMFLRDLTFIEVGNKTYEGNLVNFRKMRMVANQIKEIQKYQQHSYHFERVPVIQDYLTRGMVCLNERALHKLSKLIEPKAGSSDTFGKKSLFKRTM